MNKSILAGLVALGIGSLCDKPKPIETLAPNRIEIKANNILCGSIESIDNSGQNLILTNVILRKDQLAKIWSGGFVVKPAQRIGMRFEIFKDGALIRTFDNVWVEEMSPYQEGRDSISIARMECVVENTDEQPEQAFKTEIIIKAGGRVVGAVQSLKITEDVNVNHVKITAARVRFDRARIAEAFSRGFIHAASQRFPLQIEIKDAGTITSVNNVWVTGLNQSYQTAEWIIVDQFDAECESINSLKRF